MDELNEMDKINEKNKKQVNFFLFERSILISVIGGNLGHQRMTLHLNLNLKWIEWILIIQKSTRQRPRFSKSIHVISA